VDRDELTASLRAQREELAKEIARLTERPPDQAGTVSFGKRIGDGTTEAVERIHTTAAARSVAASLADVDRALEKLADGTYGECDVCGRPIGDERLSALPWASRCIDCSRSDQRPAR
jgi:DnaK suppressor protein